MIFMSKFKEGDVVRLKNGDCFPSGKLTDVVVLPFAGNTVILEDANSFVDISAIELVSENCTEDSLAQQVEKELERVSEWSKQIMFEADMINKGSEQLEKERILELVSAMLDGEKVYCDNGGPFPSDINGPFEKFASSVKLHGGDKYLTQTELGQREDKEKKEEELKALEDEILTLYAQKGLLLKKYEELLSS
jgi:hypothetical protein